MKKQEAIYDLRDFHVLATYMMVKGMTHMKSNPCWMMIIVSYAVGPLSYPGDCKWT